MGWRNAFKFGLQTLLVLIAYATFVTVARKIFPNLTGVVWLRFLNISGLFGLIPIWFFLVYRPLRKEQDMIIKLHIKELAAKRRALKREELNKDD